MNVITVPQKIKKGDELVIISRKDYEKFLRRKNGNNTNNIIVKRSRSFKVPKRHEKFYDELDKELTNSLREYEKGNYHGPFETAEEGIKFLESRTSAKARKK